MIPYLDSLDITASSVQSVNTVVVEEDGKLVGYNSDVAGFEAAIMNGISASKIPIKSAVCYGYGGVVSVVVAVLKKMGISVFITGRRPEEAARRAEVSEYKQVISSFIRTEWSVHAGSAIIV